MQYGTIRTTKLLDDEGSTEKTEENYVDGVVKRPVRRDYEIRHRVYTKAEEQDAYLKFSEELAADPKRLDPVFRIERTQVGNKNGFYYAITCYTLLEYDN